MRSTFYGLEIAKTGLFTSQNQLDLTGHNISNVNTIGYTRQRIATAALPPLAENTYINVDRRAVAGRGVETICIDQIRNPFLDYQYRKESSTYTNWSTREQYFGYTEALFNDELEKIDSNSGLTSIFKNFYNSLHALTESPQDKSIRENVRQAGLSLTDSMNYYYDQLVKQQDTLNESVKVGVDEINEIARQIAELNEQIFGYELNGAKANDLRDQRNLLIDQLSALVDIEQSEDSNGQLRIKIDGKTLVRHSSYNQLAVAADVTNNIDGENDLYGIYWADADGNPMTGAGYEVKIRGGAMRGYLDVRDGDMEENMGIPYIVEMLNKACQKVVEQFNEVHRKGYTIPGETNNTSRTGINFFDVPPGGVTDVTAKNFALSADILEDVYNIAASDEPVLDPNSENSSHIGNNKIALELVALIHNTDADGKQDNLDSVYKDLLNKIALELATVKTRAKTQGTVLANVDQQRVSISGVSLDEEMTNLIRFGHSYSAASRMITAIDEELDTLINRMGLVGRS